MSPPSESLNTPSHLALLTFAETFLTSHSYALVHYICRMLLSDPDLSVTLQAKCYPLLRGTPMKESERIRWLRKAVEMFEKRLVFVGEVEDVGKFRDVLGVLKGKLRGCEERSGDEVVGSIVGFLILVVLLVLI